MARPGGPPQRPSGVPAGRPGVTPGGPGGRLVGEEHERRRNGRAVAVVTGVIWRAADVAAVFGVDESTIHRWERTGRLRAARRDPGGTKYWLPDEIGEDLRRPAPERVPAAAPRPLDVGDLVVATRKQRRRRTVR